MKVLVVGGGGREHALCWKLARSPRVSEVLCAPGNPGTAALGRNLPVPANDIDGLVRAAVQEQVGLVVVGPEDPLCAGLADRLRAKGIAVFGPGASGARLEGSKMFTKELLERHRIPTAAWRRFDRSGLAKSYLETVKTWPQVVKADGLAAGKGVFICKDLAEARSAVDALMEEKRLGEAGVRIVIEEFLEGQEVSVMALTDGHTLLMLEPAVDHKQVGDGDTGPNTGGMGVVAPAPFVGKRLALAIEQRVFLPLLHALNLEEIPFRGVLFAGLMVSDAGPKVLEFNVRFGDPETQAVLRRLESDLFPYLLGTAEGKLEEQEPPRWSPGVSVCVVGCAAGYPGEVRRGDPITGLERLDGDPRAVLFHAGTRQEGRHVVTSGGRVLCATGTGEDLEQAREQAYGLLKRVHFEGLFFRRDIGQRPVRVV